VLAHIASAIVVCLFLGETRCYQVHADG
jgi:hypothetical protein